MPLTGRDTAGQSLNGWSHWDGCQTFTRLLTFMAVTVVSGGLSCMEKIETCYDEDVLCWLEKHLVMIPMEPRRPGCSVVEGKDITREKVVALASAADRCWAAIMKKDLKGFAEAYLDSFHAQTAMFPAMIQGCVQGYIEKYKKLVLAYKMSGAGGGGYLACVVEDSGAFAEEHEEAILLTIRRP